MHKFRHRLVAGLLVIASLSIQSPGVARAQKGALSPEQQNLREIFQELIEINTVDPDGDVTRAAEAMRARLLAAGFAAEDARVLVPAGNAKKGNLVARFRSPARTGKKPLLLLAHIDVVEARREDWSGGLDPFKFTERDGYYYGRGTMDDKAMAAIFVANLIRLKRENFRPDRDIIVALTTDEETGDFNGVEFLLHEHRALVDAEFGINEGGRGYLKDGRPLLNAVQASEKVYQSFRLEVRNKGGHSSLPLKDNAIFRLAAGLDRLARFDFPVNLNEVTRAYFERMSKLETGTVADDMKLVAAQPATAAQRREQRVEDAAGRLSRSPYYNALMRTTCVATRLEGGHADNALPQMARATVNCRILPQENAAEVEATLKRVIADEQIGITPIAVSKPSPPSPLRPEIMMPIERLTREMWPNVPVVPIMGTGATDSLFFRQAGIPVYGVSGIFDDIDDNRTHGRDERIATKSLYDGQEFLYRLTKAFSSPQ
jgi:acetylornithine deacetylase/succinyl-diaminopimelate desuccinylase-like protein